MPTTKHQYGQYVVDAFRNHTANVALEAMDQNRIGVLVQDVVLPTNELDAPCYHAYTTPAPKIPSKSTHQLLPRDTMLARYMP